MSVVYEKNTEFAGNNPLDTAQKTEHFLNYKKAVTKRTQMDGKLNAKLAVKLKVKQVLDNMHLVRQH